MNVQTSENTHNFGSPPGLQEIGFKSSLLRQLGRRFSHRETLERKEGKKSPSRIRSMNVSL